MKKSAFLISMLILIGFSLTVFFVTRFDKSDLITRDGFFVSGNKIDEVLLNDNKVAKTERVNLEKVSTTDTFYVNLNKVYVGEEKKKEVNTLYPLFINNGLGVVNLDSKSKLINKKFDYFDSYENFTITDGKLYNFGDNEQADYEDYILLRLYNGTFVNLLEIKVLNNSGEHIIPVNSIINIQENYINYYYYDKDGKLIYGIVDGINLENQLNIGKFKYSYEKFLIGLDKLETDKNEPEIEEEKPNEEEYIIENGNNNSGNNISNKYVAPKVSVTNFTANVYSANASLSISDPSRVIVGGINFQFFVNDKVFLRKTFVSGGKVEVTGLVPNTKFKIVGTYKYYNEESKKMEMTFFEQELSTLGVDSLEPISLKFNNGTVYSNKIELKDLQISSDLKSETIKGVNKAVIIINDEQFSISTAYLQEIMNGKSVTYTSPPKIKSNIPVNYEIRFLDAYSNAIKLINNTGNTRTSKNAPTATIRVTSSAVNEVVFNINLKNIDEVNIDNYHYVISDLSGNIFEEKVLDSNEASQNVSLKNLDPNTTYNVKIYGNYDIENGQGTMLNQVIGEGKFTTAPLSSLGFFRIVSSPEELTSHSVKISSTLDVINVSSILVELLNSLNMTITDEEDNIIYTHTYTEDELISIKAGESFETFIDGLSSVTTYNVNYSAVVKQGTVTEDINVLCSLKNFKTYKLDAEIQLRNEFVTSNMIDFDVRVVDIDGAIESGRVLLEIRDSKGTLVSKEYLDINADYVQFSYTKLNPEEKYTFNYIAEEYNKGFTNSTYEGDYILLKKEIVTEDGISGEIELINLLRDITGRNLFNLQDYNRIRKEGYTGYKEYDIKNNSVMFGAKNGYVTYSYYLPEAYQRIVTLTFKARYNKDTPNKAPVYISLGYGNNQNFVVSNIGDEYKEYSYTVYMTSNYLGFDIAETTNKNKKTTVDFKDIQMVFSDEAALKENDLSMSIHPSRHVFSNTQMIDGDSEMPNWNSSGTMIGNAGNGHARITRMSDGKVYDFNYKTEKVPYEFSIPSSGIYKIECWGAAGGDNFNPVGSNRTAASRAGRGAYTTGEVTLDASTTLYVYVGGAGVYSSTTAAGGWNGGGKNGGGSASSGSGGGATDVRVKNGNWDNLESLQSRIMVAAGGGGADNAGGTLNGGDDGRGGSGGTFFGKNAYINGVIQMNTFSSQINGSAFGIGGNPTGVTDTGGGGGGYWGGRTTNNGNGGAAGGSSYISGHLGCIAYNQVDEFLKYENYQENSQYKGTFDINIRDTRNELVNKDYYVRIYRKGEFQQEYQYLMSGDSSDNVRKTYDFDKNVSYSVVLAVKMRDRYYDIDSIEFTTETEIRAITTTAEFFAMHPDGKYLVLNDLDFSRIGTVYTSWYYGQIDFQGHKLIRNVQSAGNRLFEQFRSSAVLKNVNMEMHLDNPTGREWYYGLITYNFGTIDNIYLTVEDATLAPNYVFTLMTYANYGTIKNFVINSKAPVSALAAVGLAAWSNQGVLRNGYVYGENMYAYHQNVDRRSRKDVAPLAGETYNNSRIENVFSLISVEKNNNFGTGEKELSVGNLVGYHGSGYIANAYSVELSEKENTNIVSRDPNIGSNGSVRRNNIYYVSDKTYGGSHSNKVSKLALYDKTFQNQTLNTYDGFEVDKFVDLGYFPQVKLNECMPKQEWIELPKVTDADLIDVTSVEEIENYGDSSLVKLHINNPSNEPITKLTITDINKVEIKEQVNSFGKTELTVKLSEPRAYKSRYYVDTLWMKPAYGPEYTKTYERNERSINIDLYYPINNRNDWKIMVSNPSQNYCLMNDIDFKDVGSISSYVVNGTFNAKFDGRGHTIQNITINSNNGMFNSVTGTIKNLFVKNYKKTNNTAYGGFVYQSSSNATFDNVHIDGCQVFGRDRVGGLIGSADSVTIRNSSVTGFKVSLPVDQENSYIGGIVGFSNLTFIENSYAQDVDINITDSLSTLGVGGIAGRMNQGTLNKVYATGNIKANTINVGGLIGWNNATVSNVWSYVNLSTELDYVGGIVGKSDNSNINNSLSIGAVYSRYVSNQGNNVHRTSGNALAVIQSNYAWDKQKYYGYVTGESASEVLISTEDLEEITTYQDLIGFDDYFDYSQIQDDILPKIKNADTMELLPGQKDVKLETEEFDVRNIEIEPTATNATIHMTIENPNQYEITAVEFDYLKIITQRYVNSASDGTTDIYLTVSPEMYFDSYTFTKVKYKDSTGANQTYDKIVRIELQFFKLLSSFDGWNQISTKYAENYRITGDIDLSQVINPRTGVIFGRLEGLVNDSGVNYKIMGLNKTGISQSKYNLIRMITTTLKNITFDNITFETVNKSYNYINVIYLNYSDIENVEFNNITIKAPNSGYVAPIGEHRGQNIDNVRINNNNIRGTRNVAGLLAYTYNTSTTDITARDCTIYGTSNFAGGIIAEKPWINAYNSFRYYGYNMNVTGVNYVGGLFGQGGAVGAYIYDSNITGINNGSMIGGISGYNNYENDNTHLVSGCTIVASSSNVGGLHGRALHFNNGQVINTTIRQTNSSRTYVGGAWGYQDGYGHQNISVVDVDIENAGDYTGGITGRLNSAPSLTYSFTNNVTIKGRNYVGGVAGSSNTARLYQNLTNVNINATGNYVGGAFGYISSIHATDNAYSAIVYECLIANSVVSGNNYVGGFVGNTNGSQLTPAKFYNNIIVADVTTKATSDVYAGAINGRDNRNYAGISMTTFKLYENNRLNGQTLKNLKLSMIPTANLATSTNLKTQSYYTNFGYSTARWDFNSINTYFPRVKNWSGGSPRPEQKRLTIPTATIVFARMNKVIAPVDHIIPNMVAYTSGINSINLEFDSFDEYTSFAVYDGETKVFEQGVDERCYTVNYDFQSKLKVVVTDGRNSKTYDYSNIDFRNLASTYGKKYAYIYNGELKGNIDNVKTKGKFIHIYNNLALTDELEVVDIISGEKLDGSFAFNVSLADNATPLYKFDYKDSKFDTFYNYTVIKRDGADIIYDNQLLVKNGSIEIVDSNLDSYHNMVIIDNYSNDNYVTVLGENGNIYNLKSSIAMPSNFSNKSIRFMTNNINSDTSAVILVYDTGKIVVFDYRTGKEIKTEKSTEDVSIIEYFKQNFSNNDPLIKNEISSNYQEALDLKELLSDNPIEVDSNGSFGLVDSTDNEEISEIKKKSKNYVTYYNSVRDDYDILDVSSILNEEDSTINDSSDIITEKNKIYTSNALVEYYMKKSLFAEVFENINGLYIFGILFGALLTALFIGSRNTKRLKSTEEE